MADTDQIIFTRDEFALIVELAGGSGPCSLDRKPGENWVEGAGGLPNYICHIARAIHKTGKTISQSIAIAVSRVKKWAAGADDVDADTRAKAAKAVAQWEALKVKNKAKQGAKKAAGAAKPSGDRDKVKASSVDTDILCLANVDFNVDIVRKAFEKRQREARKAWRAANPNGTYEDGPQHLYIKEQWTNYLIVATGYGDGPELFKVPYEVAADASITFSDPVPVKTEYVVVSGADIGDDGKLSTADLQRLMELTGPCTKSAATVLLQLTPRPSALDKVIAAARKK